MLRPDVRRLLGIQALATLVCFATELFCRFALHLRQPYDRPILTDRFPDFVLIKPRFEHYHALGFFHTGPYNFMYPAPAAFFYEPFMRLPAGYQTATFVLALLTTFLAAGLLFAKALVRRKWTPPDAARTVIAGILLSYPLWFEMDRANIEMFLWATVALGVWAFVRGKESTAAVCFGLAASAKLYPVVYLGLFLARRRYRPILVGVLTASLSTVVGLWLMYPDISISFHQVQIGLQQFQSVFVHHIRPVEIGFDHSLFSVYKQICKPNTERLQQIAPLYLLLAGVAGVVLFFTRIVRLPLANQVVLLTVATILLPPVSFDYTLLHLYTPLCFVLTLGPRLDTTKQGRLILLLFALLLAPLTEFIWHGERLEGQIKALLLLALFVAGLIWHFDGSDLPASLPYSSNGGTPAHSA